MFRTKMFILVCLEALLVSPSSSPGLGVNWILAGLHPPWHHKTHLNYTQLNTPQLNSSHLTFGPSPGLILAPLGPPNRPKIGPSRLLTPDFFQKRNFSRNVVSPPYSTTPRRPQDGTQDDPKSTQDRSKTIFKSIFFRPRF